MFLKIVTTETVLVMAFLIIPYYRFCSPLYNMPYTVAFAMGFKGTNMHYNDTRKSIADNVSPATCWYCWAASCFS
jgi:hypothetical protein